jgi:hypothetical protein
VSLPARKHPSCAPPEPRYDEDLLELQRRGARQGLGIVLPTAGPEWELPDLIEVEGELASEALIRLRRANRP